VKQIRQQGKHEGRESKVEGGQGQSRSIRKGDGQQRRKRKDKIKREVGRK